MRYIPNNTRGYSLGYKSVTCSTLYNTGPEKQRFYAISDGAAAAGTCSDGEGTFRAIV